MTGAAGGRIIPRMMLRAHRAGVPARVILVRHRWAVWAAGAGILALLAAGVWWTARAGADGLVAANVLPDAIAAVSAGMIGLLIGLRRPGNVLGPLFLVIAASGAASFAANRYVTQAGASTAAVWAGWVGSWVWLPDVLVTATLVVAAFPDGSFRSTRWRHAALATGGSIFALMAVIAVLDPTTGEGGQTLRNPLAVPPSVRPVLLAAAAVPAMVVAAMTVAALVSLLRRWRRSHGVARTPITYLLIGGVLAIGLQAPGTPNLANAVGVAAIPVAVGIAVLRHNLYDLDVVVNRSLVYLALTAGVVGVYVVAVSFVGDRLGANGTLRSSVLAAAVVAVAFQPARNWLQRWVDRLLYGQGRDPYAAVTSLVRGLEVQTADPLSAAVATIAGALRLGWVAVELPDGSSCSVGTPTGMDVVRVPLTHRGQPIGMLAAAGTPGRKLGRRDRQLLADLAPHVAATWRAAELAEQLQHSREQLVLAREDERRRLRRDLHDGLGPTLAGIAAGLEAVQANGADHLPLLDRLSSEAQAAIRDVRRVVDDLRPPALDELGLIGAIRQRAAALGGASPSWQVHAPPDLPPLPAAVEVAAYRITAEALANVARHARATMCTVRVGLTDGRLTLRIADDGTGVATARDGGVGLMSMAERAAELGGRCTVTSTPGHGTVVSASLPAATR